MGTRSGMTEMTLPPGVRSDRIETLWSRVDRNRIKVTFFSLAFSAVVSFFIAIAIAFAMLLVGLLLPVVEVGMWIIKAGLFITFPLAFLGTLGWVYWRLSRSERFLLKRIGGRITDQGEIGPVKRVLKDMSIAVGFDHSPPLYIIEVDKVNAFAVGRSHATAAIGVTSGFVDKLTPDEQRAVFANLMARIKTLDTLYATAVSALMGPIWAMREHDLTMKEIGGSAAQKQAYIATAETRTGPDAYAAWFVIYGLVVVVTEILSWWHLESAWMASEKADAEGMLLLKDPRSMLAALERVLDADNFVPSAGDAYSQLFYCWAGFGFAPEDDPEFRRVSRLREVLGAEGLAERPSPNLAGWGVAPRAPRLEEDA
jgi:Zn-dependent protease with chaperone function